MKTKMAQRAGVAALAAVTLIGSVGCSGGDNSVSAASAKDLGGVAALVDAAKKEGTLNVIGLPSDWVNYGEVIKGFETKYGLKVVSAQPDASSADEISSAKDLQGKPTAPDVFDLSGPAAQANTGMFAAYKVATFDDVPAALKDANGLWVSDYGGYMSIGYDAAKVPPPATVADLLTPAYKGKVAINGDPTQPGPGLSGVAMVALSQGGTADDISKGVDFFKALKGAGSFLPDDDPTSTTIRPDLTPVVLAWDYLNVAAGKEAPDQVTWKTVIPAGAVVGGYRAQAINKDAPHPNAARLWQEYVYSDAGQNLWLKGSTRPVREAAMVKAGTIDKAAYAALPKVEGTPLFLTAAQTEKAKAYLTANWAKAIG